MRHVSNTPRTFALNKAAERVAGKSPCKDCEDRYPGCSGHCEKFAGWKQRVMEAKREFAKQDSGARDAEKVLQESYFMVQERIRRKGHPRKT